MATSVVSSSGVDSSEHASSSMRCSDATRAPATTRCSDAMRAPAAAPGAADALDAQRPGAINVEAGHMERNAVSSDSECSSASPPRTIISICNASVHGRRTTC